MAATSTKGISSYIRCRPPTRRERAAGDVSGLTIDTVAGTVASRSKQYAADKVFSQHATQDSVYRVICPAMEDDVIDGFNCVLFAYGQTGTGKTHTMEGDIDDPVQMGLIPRMIKSLFEKLEATGKSYRVYVSAVELYNERFIECIDGGTESGKSKVIKLQDSKLVNAENVLLDDAAHAQELLRQAQSSRKVSSTKMNTQSSRSHFIFTMRVTVRSGGGMDGSEACVTTGTLSVVDLAGSECVGKSGAVGSQARESKNINKSNEALKRVVENLGRNASHIPYRDSKLTQLLEPALGGNAKTAIIGTVGPSKASIGESKSTLGFVASAQKIKNKVARNEGTTVKGAAKQMSAENDRLRRLLAAARSGSDTNITKVPTEVWEKAQAEVAEQKQRLTDFQSLVNERSVELEAQLIANKELHTALAASKAEHAAVASELKVTTATLVTTAASLEHEEERANVAAYEATTIGAFAAQQTAQARAQQIELLRQARAASLLADASDRRSALVSSNLQRVAGYASDVAPLLTQAKATTEAYATSRTVAARGVAGDVRALGDAVGTASAALAAAATSSTATLVATIDAIATAATSDAATTASSINSLSSNAAAGVAAVDAAISAVGNSAASDLADLSTTHFAALGAATSSWSAAASAAALTLATASTTFDAAATESSAAMSTAAEEAATAAIALSVAHAASLAADLERALASSKTQARSGEDRECTAYDAIFTSARTGFAEASSAADSSSAACALHIAADAEIATDLIEAARTAAHRSFGVLANQASDAAVAMGDVHSTRHATFVECSAAMEASGSKLLAAHCAAAETRVAASSTACEDVVTEFTHTAASHAEARNARQESSIANLDALFNADEVRVHAALATMAATAASAAEEASESSAAQLAASTAERNTTTAAAVSQASAAHAQVDSFAGALQASTTAFTSQITTALTSARAARASVCAANAAQRDADVSAALALFDFFSKEVVASASSFIADQQSAIEEHTDGLNARAQGEADARFARSVEGAAREAAAFEAGKALATSFAAQRCAALEAQNADLAAALAAERAASKTSSSGVKQQLADLLAHVQSEVSTLLDSHDAARTAAVAASATTIVYDANASAKAAHEAQIEACAEWQLASVAASEVHKRSCDDAATSDAAETVAAVGALEVALISDANAYVAATTTAAASRAAENVADSASRVEAAQEVNAAASANDDRATASAEDSLAVFANAASMKCTAAAAASAASLRAFEAASSEAIFAAETREIADAEANAEHFAATAATVAQQASEASSAATVAKESSFAACCADSSAEETALRTEANELSQTIASYAAAHNALVAEMRSSAAVEAEAMTSYLSEASSSLVATSSAELDETSTMLSMHCASAARMSEECGAAVDVAASAAETAIATRASAAIESNEASMEALLHCMGAGETNAAAVKDAARAAAKLSHTAASESAATRRVDAMALFAAHAAAATDAATSSQAATLARIFEIDAAISTFGEARSAAVSEAAEANSEGCAFANECVVSASTAAAAAADAMNAGVSSAQELLERSVRGTLVRDVASVHAAMARGAEMHGAKIGAARDVIAVNCEEVHIHCDTHIAAATAVAVDSIAQGVDAEISVCVLSFWIS